MAGCAKVFSYACLIMYAPLEICVAVGERVGRVVLPCECHAIAWIIVRLRSFGAALLASPGMISLFSNA